MITWVGLNMVLSPTADRYVSMSVCLCVCAGVYLNLAHGLVGRQKAALFDQTLMHRLNQAIHRSATVEITHENQN
jgi:hypothetical protein